MILSSLFFVCLLVCIDQYSKLVVNAYISYGDKLEIIPKFFYLTNVRNTGAAWSMFEGQQLLFIAITIVAIIFFIYLLYKERNKALLTRICYLLIISGAIGNLIDRVTNSYVVDFLDFYIFGYDFPVFNVADMFLTIGVIILIITILLENKHAKN